MDDQGAAQHAGGAASMMEGWTTASLILIAVLALLAVAVIVWGIRLKRRRVAADRQVIESREERGIDPQPRTGEDQPPAPTPVPTSPAAAPAPVPELRAAPPVAPSPPPLADTPPVPVPAPATPPAGMPDTPIDREERDARAEAPLADEPIAAAAPMDASPASLAVDLDTAAEPAPAPGAETLTGPAAGSLPLNRLKGLGPKLAAQLAELGYTDVQQIADLSPAEADALDARLGAFKGRMARDRWIEQARLLTTNRAAYEAEFGKLG
ncbi:hypothetical protein [Sphingomonas aracearum]|uniref:Uncharacterized protein n=1 Tax=Sphingomonas aracearum TaxID=2283317 RepID=A0A369VY44_9SPHN|nr:hypothetical protein [Sphingomonas aracearum]RDE07316.1 hypothetical protein DVW87_06745 [Sphingomonas aracearum]